MNPDNSTGPQVLGNHPLTPKNPLVPQRVRRIKGSFAAVEHRFLRDGFWQSLSHNELLLYFFLVLVGDRDGISFYSYDRIITLLKLRLDEYIQARDALIDKDLLAFDGHLFQVLSLPQSPVFPPVRLLKTPDDMIAKDPATIHRTICEALGKDPDEILQAQSLTEKRKKKK